MKAYCLASSSSGNCYIFDFEIEGVSTKIMIECGIPLSHIYNKCNELNIDFSQIQACLITHYHNDHSQSCNELSKRYIPIFATKETLEHCKCQGNTIYPKQRFRVAKGLYAMPFEVEHDAEGSVGFIVKSDNDCLVFINDNKRFHTNLKAIKPNYVFIECNYDNKVVYPQYYDLSNRKEELAFEDEERKEINVKLKQLERNINSHSSLRGCMKNLTKLDLSRCIGIFLMHLSDGYSNEYRMKNEIQATFGVKTFVCQKLGGIK